MNNYKYVFQRLKHTEVTVYSTIHNTYFNVEPFATILFEIPKPQLFFTIYGHYLFYSVTRTHIFILFNTGYSKVRQTSSAYVSSAMAP